MVDQVALVQVVDQVAGNSGSGDSSGGNSAGGSLLCAMHVDATYLVNEHPSGVVTFT